jgi:hypothetical protein
MDLAGTSGPNQTEQYGVGALCGSVSGAYRTFLTVSHGEFCELRHYGVL